MSTFWQNIFSAFSNAGTAENLDQQKTFQK